MKSALPLFLSLAFTAIHAHAQWTEFRGPTRDGHTTAADLPTEWSREKNVAWRAPIPGEGWSSPVLEGGKVYLTAAVAKGGSDEAIKAERSLRLICLDAASGKILWDHGVFPQRADAPNIHKKNSHASPTPIIEGGRIYAHFGHQGTACLDLDGNPIWANRNLKYEPVHGGGGSPILVGKSLIFSCDGASNPFVAALDAGNGRLLWKTPRDTDARKTFSFATPQWFEAGGREQVAIPGSNRVVAYNPKNGDPIWFARYDGYSVIPRPVFGHGMLFVATGYDRPTVMAIRPGKGDVTGENVEWVVTKRAPHTPSMILAGDDLFWVSDSGQATCADAKTGEVIWQERVCDACSASPVYAEKSGLIYIQDERGKGVVLRAGRKFELVAENDLGERSLASYAAEDGALYIRTAEALYKIAR